jgi:DNA mismatch repair protein MutL
MKATYLVLEAPTGLMLIDQHAAHERVTYERLKVAYQDRQIPRQRLLFAATVELSPSEIALCESFSEELLALGLEVQPFGPHTMAVVEVPLLLAKGDPEKLLKGALDEFAKRDTNVSLDDKRNHLLATMACHSSVRAGQQLSGDEVRSLLASMDETDNIGHCPHGRPVYLEMNWKELEKRFGRLGNFLP